MKKVYLSVFILASLSLAKAWADNVVYSQSLVSETGLAYNNTYVLDMGASLLSNSNIDKLSLQAVYSSATIAAVTFTDGTASTATVTVSSYSALIGAQGSNTITVSSNNALSGAKFTLNGIQFINGDLWNNQSLSTNTAVSIANSINNYGGTSATFIATASSNVVTINCVSSGSFCNSFALTSTPSNVLTVGAAKFSGGKNDAFLALAGIVLTDETDFFAATNASTTAKSISDAIQANSNLSAIISSTWTSGGVVTATSTAVGAGTQYGCFSSTNAALPCSNGRLFGGTNSNIVTASSKLNVANHNLTTGLAVLYTKTAGTSPGQLVANTTYYAIRTDANNFQLASSLSNAQAGTAVSISTQTARGGGTFALTPLAYTGTPSFKLQAGNDNSNWTDLSVSSVTMATGTPASTSWDLGAINYRYLRVNVLAPTTGGLNLIVTGNGKSSH